MFNIPYEQDEKTDDEGERQVTTGLLRILPGGGDSEEGRKQRWLVAAASVKRLAEERKADAQIDPDQGLTRNERPWPAKEEKRRK